MLSKNKNAADSSLNELQQSAVKNVSESSLGYAIPTKAPSFFEQYAS